MSLIQQIDKRSVHHIQSGQVINEGITSAVKELVENSLDANTTSIEVRFKNYGLDSVEVSDNGDGVAPENYEGLALKHYTSKLRTYEDLESVTTFGFRGEALSSLCALSDLHITTARVEDAPKGVRLEFESSGKLKSQSVVAASKGTTVTVGNLFKSLPVRRRELERTIKREYAKALGILQAYAGICVRVKFSVFNQPPKGKRTPVFATKGNATTRENIANVFGAKMLNSLVPLNLQLELTPTKKALLKHHAESREVKVIGHISRPVVGEGRNAPDRQMFFVNGRPCVLPQIAKAFNEVYRGFNVTQSPFIFADLQLDTDAYDVNVSPDKRTVLLHDQTELLETMKNSLAELFGEHEQTVPINQIGIAPKLPSYKQLSISNTTGPSVRTASSPPSPVLSREQSSKSPAVDDVNMQESSKPPTIPGRDVLASQFAASKGSTSRSTPPSDLNDTGAKLSTLPPKSPPRIPQTNEPDTQLEAIVTKELPETDSELQENQPQPNPPSLDDIPSSAPPTSQPHTLPVLFRSPRRADTLATVTIGDREPVITTRDDHLQNSSPPTKKRKVELKRKQWVQTAPGTFGSSLEKFVAPGAQATIQQGLKQQTHENDISDGDEGGGSENGSSPKSEDQRMPDVDDAQARGPVEPSLPTEAKEAPAREIDERDGSPPLFPPGLGDDSDDSETPEQRPPAVGQGRGSAMEISPPHDEALDEEFIPESEIRRRVKERAIRFLKEAEERQAALAAVAGEELLERADRILRGNPKHSTRHLVRFQMISVAQISQLSAGLARRSFTLNDPDRVSGSPASTLVEGQDEAAEQRLTLTVSKRDFFNMRIKGQFNKGFILATRDDELFIIDQHASDEKYNFETLQATTMVQNQPLVVPRPLGLMAMDEEAVIEHLDIFKKNGFVVEVDHSETVGRRCKLRSLPMSKETVFGVEDLEELIHLIHQSGGAKHVRCSKVRAMFAMRACRKSVMVGKALPIKAMEKIVRHMGELDKPWNCPHGRPTMRHLAELESIPLWKECNEERGGGGLKWKEEDWAGVLKLSVEGEEDDKMEE